MILTTTDNNIIYKRDPEAGEKATSSIFSTLNDNGNDNSNINIDNNIDNNIDSNIINLITPPNLFQRGATP
jgi:hypothetical protein